MDAFHSELPTLTPAHGLAISLDQQQRLARLHRRGRKRARGRRIRTAHSKPLELLRTCDVLWAAALALLFAPPAAWLLSLTLLQGVALWAGLFLGLWLLLWLSLVNCNPYRPGYSVFDSFRSMDRALPTRAVSHATDLSQLSYPCVFKPAKCSTNSSQVQLIHSAEQARDYLIETMEEVVCAQQYHPGEEYTIMWERWPWRADGQVVELYWRKKTHPKGEFHPLSGAGTPKHNVLVNRLASAELLAAMERMMAGMPEVYCTRFDVRADNHVELQKGNFWVMESNGTVGVNAEGVWYGILVHWPRRMITGLYNIFTHPNASVLPAVLAERLRAFNKCGGWDFKFTDGY